MGACCAMPLDEQSDHINRQANDSAEHASRDKQRANQQAHQNNQRASFSMRVKAAVHRRSDDFSGLVGGAAPRIHKGRNSLVHVSSADLFTQAARSATLANCTDEQLIAEVHRRKINMHEMVTKDLVSSKYTFGRLLGQGASGSVYECRHAKSGETVAVKIIQRDEDMNDDESMTNELEILRTVRHRYILHCHELFESEHTVWVVMEIIRGGELLDILVEQGIYGEEDASRTMKQTLLAVRYLHSQGIVHRDLKLQNLLLTVKDYKTADVKVTDFGLSAILPRNDFEPANREALKAYDKLADRWGTPHYFAPELIKKRYGPQVDMWALGVVLFQVLSGRLPFNGQDAAEVFEQVLDSPNRLRALMRGPEWLGVSDAAKDLLIKLLEPNPKKRLSAEEALEHPWIALRGEKTGNLTNAYRLLRQQVARKRIADMWHVVDIMNTLEAAGAAAGSISARCFHPALIKAIAGTAFAPSGADGNAGENYRRKRAVSKTDALEELQSVFNLFDRDRSGTIETSEIISLMKKLKFHPNEEKLQAIVDEEDSNKNGQLDFDEFCRFLHKAKKTMPASGRRASQSMKSAYIKTDEVRDILKVLGEHIGIPVPDAEIEAIVAISELEEGARPENVRDALLMPDSGLAEGAEQKRKASVAKAAAASGSAQQRYVA